MGYNNIAWKMLQSKKEGKDQETIQSSTTPDPGYQWESDNFILKHHKQKNLPSENSQNIILFFNLRAYEWKKRFCFAISQSVTTH